jgi:tight adherence protein C
MPTELTLAVVLVFAAVALLSGVVASGVVDRMAPGRRRLESLPATGGSGLVVKDSPLANETDAAVGRFARYIPKSPHTMGRLRKRLARAGYHGVTPVSVYAFAELLGPVVAAGLTFLAVGTTRTGILFAVLAAIVAYLLPGLVVERLVTLRKKQIQHGLPDAIDLLIVCIEAGSSLDQSVVKASEELHLAYPALAEELRYVNTEIRAGKPRLEAFKNFAERTKVDDVRALVAMMVQTDRFGTSIAQALRTFADAARTKRRQEAEERAGKLGVKLVFPLVFCLFPALYVVLLGPAAIQIFRVLIQQIGQR